MSNRALSFIGRLDKREESIVMSQLQEKRLVTRLLGGRDQLLAQRRHRRLIVLAFHRASLLPFVCMRQ